jgi:hypothetical protein
MRTPTRILSICGALLFAAACIVSTDARHGGIGANAAGAAIFAASGVAGAVGYRAVTGGCYSSCPYGRVCDRDTGTCVEQDCVCPADLVCERVNGETTCVQPTRHERPEDGGAPDGADADAGAGSDAQSG